MNMIKCPFCLSEIQEEVLVCQYCHERVRYTRQEVLLARVADRMRFVIDSNLGNTNVSPCTVFCHYKFSGNKAKLQECLGDCKAQIIHDEMIARAAEKVLLDLVVNIEDIIWGGGDIDPLPLEHELRKRMSRIEK